MVMNIPVPIKVGGFLDQMSNYHIFQKVSAPWSFLIMVVRIV
jgi:hypothetical protein